MFGQQSKFMYLVYLFFLGGMLASCGVPSDARKAAAVVSAYTVEVQNNISEFSNSRLAINKSRLQNMDRLEENSIQTSYANNQELEAWKMTKLGSKSQDNRVALYEAIKNGTQKDLEHQEALEKFRTERAQIINDMKSAINFDGKKLGEVSKALADLSEEADLNSQVNFLVNFARGVHSGIEELQKEAESSSEGTNTGGSEVDQPSSQPAGGTDGGNTNASSDGS